MEQIRLDCYGVRHYLPISKSHSHTHSASQFLSRPVHHPTSHSAASNTGNITITIIHILSVPSPWLRALLPRCCPPLGTSSCTACMASKYVLPATVHGLMMLQQVTMTLQYPYGSINSIELSTIDAILEQVLNIIYSISSNRIPNPGKAICARNRTSPIAVRNNLSQYADA